MSLFENRFFQRDIEFPDLLLFEFSSLGELLLLMLVEKARFRIEDSLIGGGFSGLKINKADKFIERIFEHFCGFLKIKKSQKQIILLRFLQKTRTKFFSNSALVAREELFCSIFGRFENKVICF